MMPAATGQNCLTISSQSAERAAERAAERQQPQQQAAAAAGSSSQGPGPRSFAGVV
jgi:hypothetical protein